MTVSTAVPFVSYAGNDLTTVFAVPFSFVDEGELVVTSVNDATLVETVKTITTHYTVSGGAGSTGSVTMLTAPATGTTLVIERVTTIQQATDYAQNDRLPSEQIEADMDNLIRIVQEVSAQIGSAIQAPATFDPSDPPLRMPLPVDGQFLIGNSDEDGWINAELADLDLTLSAVVTSVADNELLQYNSTSGAWENVTILEAGIAGLAAANTFAAAQTFGAAITAEAAATFESTAEFQDTVEFQDVVTVGAALAMSGAAINEAHGADIASAGTVNLDTATGNVVDVTGTTTITAITLGEGRERTVRFTGALTLTNGASLVLLGGANITTAAGDYAIFRGYAAGVVRMVAYQRADGGPIARWQTYTPTVTATGGSITSYTASGRYLVEGKKTTVQIVTTITNGGTGSGGLVATLPSTPSQPSVLNFVETAVTGKQGRGAIAASVASATMVYYDGVTYPGATNSNLIITGFYETA